MANRQSVNKSAQNPLRIAEKIENIALDGHSTENGIKNVDNWKG